MWIPRRRFIGHGLRDLVEQFIPDEQVDDFAAWAFGEDYNRLNLEEFAHAWNDRHRDLYEVNIANEIVHDVAKMTTYYKNRIKDE